MNFCAEPTRKKPRKTPPSSWIRNKEYIHSEGGFIHNGITFVSSEDEIDGEKGSSKDIRCVKVSSSAILEGTELMRIPTSILVTLSTVEQSSIGPFIFQLVHGVDKDKSRKLYNPKNDVVLALFLSFVSLSEPKSTNNSDEVRTWNGVRLYLSTLPDNESYNNLPRRWGDEFLVKHLTGTSLLNRVMAEKEGLKQDYQVLSDHLESNEEMKQALSPFPAIHIFDQMLAAVASRAFDGLGEDGLEAMIPLLDLFDHKRGISETSDISYRQEIPEGGNSSFIVVTAKRDLKNGFVPGITYGAKGNAQLLARYGFTLINNTEPDGSSNDVLEFELKPNGTYIDLKRGPKAYTYGCFVKAIEAFLDYDICKDDETDENIDDMEDFLNSCEKHGEGGEAIDIYSENAGSKVVYKGCSQDEISAKEYEIRAMNSFVKSIHEARERFVFRGNDIQESLKEKDFSRKKFCAILIQSELQTLALYELAATCTISKLKYGDCDMEKCIAKTTKILQLIETFGCKESELIEKHARELSAAFYTIRYNEKLFC